MTAKKDAQTVPQTPDNLRFYQMGREVPKEACRSFTRGGGFSGTDINRMWRIRTLTAMFGPAGIGWTFNLTEIWERQLENDDRTVIYAKGELCVRDPETKEWSKPIVGYGGNDIIKVNKSGVSINDEAYKMVETDCLGSACSKLGIGASVYWSSEVSKYEVEESTPAPIKAERVKADPFFGKAETKDDRIEQNIRRTQECKKELMDWVRGLDYENLPDILLNYSKNYGPLDKMPSGIVVRLHREVRQTLKVPFKAEDEF